MFSVPIMCFPRRLRPRPVKQQAMIRSIEKKSKLSVIVKEAKRKNFDHKEIFS